MKIELELELREAEDLLLGVAYRVLQLEQWRGSKPTSQSQEVETFGQSISKIFEKSFSAAPGWFDRTLACRRRYRTVVKPTCDAQGNRLR